MYQAALKSAAYGANLRNMRSFNLTVREELLAVCRLDPGKPVPDWAHGAGFSSITRTAQELSIVCAANAVPAGVVRESDWRAFQVEGPLSFNETGILAAIAAPLAAAEISIFAISTYDTDYVLVREADAGRATQVLTAAGHKVANATSRRPEPPIKP